MIIREIEKKYTKKITKQPVHRMNGLFRGMNGPFFQEILGLFANVLKSPNPPKSPKAQIAHSILAKNQPV